MTKHKSGTQKNPRKRRNRILIILIILLILFGGVFFYFSRNFNTLIRDKITTLYSQSEVSDYYKLQFKRLRVNLFTMSVHIADIQFSPLTKKHPEFFRKNGTLSLNIGKISIKKADLFAFLSNNEVTIKRFVLAKTKIKIINKEGKFNPFAFVRHKKQNDSLKLKVHISQFRFDKTALEFIGNPELKAKYSFKDFSLELNNLFMNKYPGDMQFSFDKLLARLTKADINNNKWEHYSLDELIVGITSLNIRSKTEDYKFSYEDFYLEFKSPAITTKDSLFTISAKNIMIDEQYNKLIVNNIRVEPNYNKNRFANHFKFQTLRPVVNVESLVFANLQFNELIDNKSLFADTLYIKGLYADLYKDKTRPFNRNKFPVYLGKQIFGLKLPVNIAFVEIKDSKIDFSVRKNADKISKIDITDISGELKNLQNRDSTKKMLLNASGKIHNVVPFTIDFDFDMQKDFFSYNGKVYKSDLSKLNSVVRSFAPVSIKSGQLNSITFKGQANKTGTKGNMLFLYDNLNISVERKDGDKKKGFSNFLFTAAANSYLHSGNPAKGNPPRKVNFSVQRDMNKGFLNLLIQGLLNGIKETVAPSKENRQRYKKERKSVKKKAA